LEAMLEKELTIADQNQTIDDQNRTIHLQLAVIDHQHILLRIGVVEEPKIALPIQTVNEQNRTPGPVGTGCSSEAGSQLGGQSNIANEVV
jgi:hypothetical protein